MMGTVERAFQIAEDGTCRTIEDIRKKLTAEGRDGVAQHLSGSSIGKQLRAIMAKRGAAAGAKVAS